MSHLAGTGTLLRLALRRDRVKVPLWVVAITVLAGYCVVALDVAYPTDADLGAIVSFVQGPAGTIMSGPGYGLDPPTHAAVFAAVYGFYVLIAAAFMNVLLVVRHTRADEETGRAELVRSGVVGRHAALGAVVVLALVADVVLGVLVAAVLAGSFGGPGAVLFGASVAALGLAFAGVTAALVQVTEYARAAAALASAAIGLGVVVRGVGDVLGEHGSALSWFSPFAWAQQTRVFVEPRAWPLLPCLALLVAGAALGAVLQERRDVGAGLLAARLGRAAATRRLSSVWALALRLERTAIIGWTVGVGVAGVLYGSLAQSVQTSFADLPDDLLAVLGGEPARLVDGFVSAMVFFDVTLAACCGVAVVHRLTSEESSARAELVLATATSRVRWMGAGLVAALVGVVSVLMVSGACMGVATAAVLGDGDRVPQILLAHLTYLPAATVVVASAGLGFAVRPGWVHLAWALVGWAVFVGYFGELIDLPGAVAGLSPFEHVARLPLDAFAAGPLVALVAVAAAIVVAALAVFRRRDLTAG
jgi:ABC-2 type transport system permease protein